ncbi:MAG: nitrogenase [Firmicutes bacterium HGW-Firmicutes-8]|nr:MAG: nitrogenase [Firmicutes bacterium HGW-Firmicutes-8]
MARDIAVFLGVDGETVSLYEPGRIVVYRRKLGEWNVLREKPFSIDRTGGIKELRQKIKEMLDFLDDCNIFVAFSVVGVPYYELEKAEYRVWEFEGSPPEFLDHILDTEEAALKQSAPGHNDITPLVPVETSAGCYQISLSEIQANNAGITSKQALLPFLRKGLFYSLEVLCSHVPPWLEVEMASGNLNGSVEYLGPNEFKVTIGKKLCG